MIGKLSGSNLCSTKNINSPIMFKGERKHVDKEQKSDTFEKQGMSAGKKAAIGFGSILALVACGFGIKKHLDNKAIKKVTMEAMEALQNRTYKKSVNAGKNVQETINNILGENSGITPHSYDLSKELPVIHVYRNQGGYKDGLVTPSGIDASNNPYSSKLIRKASSHSPVNGNVPDVKNKVVRISVKDVKAETNNPTNYLITFISPNQKYTPLQKDVLKLIEHPEKVDAEIFDKICKFKDALDKDGNIILENVGVYENLDYDLILSAIQSMAKK